MYSYNTCTCIYVPGIIHQVTNSSIKRLHKNLMFIFILVNLIKGMFVFCITEFVVIFFGVRVRKAPFSTNNLNPGYNQIGLVVYVQSIAAWSVCRWWRPWRRCGVRPQGGQTWEDWLAALDRPLRGCCGDSRHTCWWQRLETCRWSLTEWSSRTREWRWDDNLKERPNIRGEISPGSRLRTSTDSFRGEILSAASTHSVARPRLYSTRKAVIGEPPLALGIQVTYTELSVAMEMVGRSGASGTEI